MKVTILKVKESVLGENSGNPFSYYWHDATRQGVNGLIRFRFGSNKEHQKGETCDLKLYQQEGTKGMFWKEDTDEEV